MNILKYFVKPFTKTSSNSPFVLATVSACKYTYINQICNYFKKKMGSRKVVKPTIRLEYLFKTRIITTYSNNPKNRAEKSYSTHLDAHIYNEERPKNMLFSFGNWMKFPIFVVWKE